MEIAASEGFVRLSDKERRRIIRSNLEELERRKEKHEIDTVDYELDYLYYHCQYGIVVENSDLKRFAQHPNGQAINITKGEFSRIKRLTGNNLKIILVDGVVCEIDPERMGYRESDRLIIFPEELGSLTPAETS